MSSGSFLYPEAVDFYEYDEGPKESTAEYLDLIRLLKKEVSIPVMKTIGDFRGELSQANVKNPAAYERVQFMKYFRGHEAEPD